MRHEPVAELRSSTFPGGTCFNASRFFILPPEMSIPLFVLTGNYIPVGTKKRRGNPGIFVT